MPQYIGAIDQGTTSTRFLIFDQAGNHVTSHQLEFDQIYPRPGYAKEGLERVKCILNPLLVG
jgi:glycerol kinase